MEGRAAEVRNAPSIEGDRGSDTPALLLPEPACGRGADRASAESDEEEGGRSSGQAEAIAQPLAEVWARVGGQFRWDRQDALWNQPQPARKRLRQMRRMIARTKNEDTHSTQLRPSALIGGTRSN